MIVAEKAAAQLEQLLNEYSELAPKSQYDDLSDLSEGRVLANRLLATIRRLTLPGSSYAKQVEGYSRSPVTYTKDLVGVATALRDDLRAGWLESVVELVHADTHSDFLEMAGELLRKGYKDAAAVIAGSSLEVHIKGLCVKHGVVTEVNGKPKKADTMNADLVKAGVYGTLEQKQITAWLSLRNLAAHGEYGKYDTNAVDHLIRGIRDFIIKYSA